MKFKKDFLEIQIHETAVAMGQAAAQDIAGRIHDLLKEKDEINMIFAAAPSQNEVLAALTADVSIPWQKINAFHMDEYIGLPVEAPQRFARFLQEAIFGKVGFKSVHLMDSTAAPEKETARYAALLQRYPADIVCMGIGENGHIAFNDPHVADFHDPQLVKAVELDAVCRMQQVHDGCFDGLEQVPRSAMTLTVPALARADYHFCVVPTARKAEAVRRAVQEKIDVRCPASILRTLPNAILYCDRGSGQYLL